MSADGVAEVKTALQGRVGNGEGLALVRQWMSAVGSARDQAYALRRRVSVVEDEFLDYPAHQTMLWLDRLMDNLDHLARKLGSNQ